MEEYGKGKREVRNLLSTTVDGRFLRELGLDWTSHSVLLDTILCQPVQHTRYLMIVIVFSFQKYHGDNENNRPPQGMMDTALYLLPPSCGVPPWLVLRQSFLPALHYLPLLTNVV